MVRSDVSRVNDGLLDGSQIPPSTGLLNKDTSQISAIDHIYDPGKHASADNGDMGAGSRSPSLVRLWWLETVACVAFLGAMAALIAVLGRYQDQPLPKWPLYVSINSFISIVVIILRATASFVLDEGMSQLKWAWFDRPRRLQQLSTFDEASRGPIGACSLLWTLRGRNILAALGATVVIISLLAGPFAQLLVQYYDCPVYVPQALARIPRRNTFTIAAVSGRDSSLSHGLQFAVYAGLDNPRAGDISSICDTGNCTYEQEYHSVGYCSSCTDVTSDVSQQCELGYYSMNDSDVSLIDIPANATVLERESYDIRTFTTLLPLDNGTSNISTSSSEHKYAADIYQHMAMRFDTFHDSLHILMSNLTEYPSQAVCDSAEQKSDLGLYGLWSSYLSALPLQEWGRVKTGDLGNFLVTVDVGCLSSTEVKSMTDNGFSINETTRWLRYGGPGFMASGLIEEFKDMPQLSARCTYAVHRWTLKELRFFLKDFFDGNHSSSVKSELDRRDTRLSVQLLTFFNSGNGSLEHVNATLAGIADSITAYIRQRALKVETGIDIFDNDTYLPVEGKAFRTEICVRVRWIYIVVPATVAALTLLFFAAIITQTARQTRERRRGWKSSPLALLFHGLDPGVRDQLGPIEHLPEMETAAKHLTVRLVRTEKGTRLVTTT